MTNKQIIDVLHEISELLELKGENKFKIRAYQKLSSFLSGYEKQLADVYAEEGKKGLMKVPNLGEGIAKKIAELIDTGRLEYIDDLKKSLPEGVLTFLEIPGMGPKTAYLLGDKFRLKTVSSLEKFLRSGKLRNEKGFGEKAEEKLLKGIEMYKKGRQRMLMGEAYYIADRIIKKLKKKHKISMAKPAGSLRRMEDTVGDIDILAVSTDSVKIMETFASMDIVENVIEKKTSVYVAPGIQADLRVFEKQSFGAAMQYFTGSREHNVILREIAVKKGLTLNEYGLFKGKKKIAGDAEEEIYRALGMQYIPPELRSGAGETDLALKKAIPPLLEEKDIKGDFHIHSVYSDGENGIDEIVEEAKKRGYKYIAITDHSQSLRIAGGLAEENLRKQAKEIDRINKREKDFHVFKGSEVDILEDGSLDYPDDILKELDIVIGAVHSRFKMSRDVMTERILKAMDNKYLGIIAHISGRLINMREPYELDYPRIFEKAAGGEIAIEINANPERLDIADIYAKEAVKAGVTLAISTDAHSTETMDFIRFGAGKARKAMAGKSDVLNARTAAEIKKWVKKRRSI